MNKLISIALIALSMAGFSTAEPLDPAIAIDGLEPAWRVPLSVSADGQTVAYCLMQGSRKQPMLATDHYRSETGVFAESIGTDIWVADSQTGEATNLTGGKGSNFAPVWSPKGRRLSFLSDRDGAVRLWIWEDGELRRVSPEIAWMEVGFDRPVWTPDGESLILKLLPSGMSVEEAATLELAERNDDEQPDALKRQSPPKVYSYVPGEDEEAQLKNTMLKPVSDLALVSLDGRVQRLVGQYHPGGWAVSPDGEWLAYTTMEGKMSTTSQVPAFSLHLLQIDNGETRTLVPRFPSDWGKSVSWSPDSRHLAYSNMPDNFDYKKAQIYVVDLNGENRQVADGDFYQEFAGPNWLNNDTLLLQSPKELVICPIDGTPTTLATLESRELVTTGENGRPLLRGDSVFVQTTEGLATVNLRDGSVTRECSGRANLAAGRETGSLFTVRTDTRTGPELRIDRSPVHRFNPLFTPENTGETRLVEYTDSDGRALKAAVLLPSKYEEGRRYPAVFEVYGGFMGSKRVRSFGLRGAGVDNMQLLASRGYVVVCPDIPIDNDPLQDIGKAVHAAADAVVAEGLVDPERMAVLGHSYGGYTTLSVATQSPRFKAFICRSGIYNLLHEYLSFKNGRSSHLSYTETGQGGMKCTPWENLPRYLENSPVYHLEKVNAPVLLIHGDADNEASVRQTGEVFVGLRRLGKPVTYVSYPGEGHWEGTWTREHTLDYWNRVLEFLDENLHI